ncbi:DUF3039 domain-containing protein [Cellulomonas rhizosphaerae]|uniref:DUF3039 domain-containing protein n=1 Tax=Cellulomonas rhizosphaerae TaxID=2293719 RepID=A0A413RJM5_9CELL|nr:DUF3039 domain-containing protein [Cellulomonas rhizosphaerae]RHA38724.1 DUF3039 domain-containing protein [Cellulomonas rhizosphaerae]
MTDTDSRLDVEIDLAPLEHSDDPNLRAHIVRPIDNGVPNGPKGEGVTAQDVIDLARLNGTEVVALCGHRFVPKHSTVALTACGTCFEAAAAIGREERW